MQEKKVTFIELQSLIADENRQASGGALISAEELKMLMDRRVNNEIVEMDRRKK